MNGDRNMERSTPAVCIVGRRTLQTELLRQCLVNECGLCAEIASVEAAVKCLSDIFLVDAQGQSDEQITAILRQLHADQQLRPIALVFARDDHPMQHLVMFPFLRGMFFQDCGNEDFCRGMKALLAGEHWLPRRWLGAYLDTTRLNSAATLATEQESLIDLTPKERQVLLLLMEGLSNADIAERMFVSTHTIKTHLQNLFRKLGVSSRAKAIHWGVQHVRHQVRA